MKNMKCLKMCILCLFSGLLFACGLPTELNDDSTIETSYIKETNVDEDSTIAAIPGNLNVEIIRVVNDRALFMQTIEEFLYANNISQDQIVSLEFSITEDDEFRQVSREALLIWSNK